jgi:hypothetical protein
MLPIVVIEIGFNLRVCKLAETPRQKPKGSDRDHQSRRQYTRHNGDDFDPANKPADCFPQHADDYTVSACQSTIHPILSRDGDGAVVKSNVASLACQPMLYDDSPGEDEVFLLEILQWTFKHDRFLVLVAADGQRQG